MENTIIVRYSTFVIKENKLCPGLIYLNGKLMITGSLLYAISSKQVDCTCKQCTIKLKRSNGPTVHFINDMTSELVNTSLFVSHQAQDDLS